MNGVKERHVFVSIWFWLVIVANLCMSIYCAITMFDVQSINQILGLGLIAALGLCNVLGTILLFRWNKNGFFLFIVTTILSALVNILLLNQSIVVGLQNFVAVFIWYGILQIRKNGISAWKFMKAGWDYKHCRHLYQFFGVLISIPLILSFTIALQNPTTASVSIDYHDDDTLLVNVEKSKEENDWGEDSVKWVDFYDDQKACVIEAPGHFKKVQFSDDQILGLVNTDYDPAIIVIQEPVRVLESLGIVTVEKYANLIVQNNQKQNASGSFKKIREQTFNGNSYLIEYEMDIDGTNYRYNVLAAHTDSYYYSCQVFCLSEYADKLQSQISRMLNSFKPIK